MILNSLVIGCGEIGAFYDKPGDSNTLTHANAYFKNKNYKLVGFVDLNVEKAKMAAEIWECEYYSSIKNAFKKNTINIVSVCVPEKFHYDVLLELSQYNGIFVFTEKPYTTNVDDAVDITNILTKNNISCSVNFKRNFIPEFKNFFRDFKNNKYGEFNFGVCYYNRGFIHNGSHVISILNELFSTTKIDVLNKFEQVNDYENDPSHSFLVRFNNDFNFLFKTFNNDNYPIFELDFHFKNARIRIKDLGKKMEIHKKRKNKIFENFSFIELDKVINTKLESTLDYSLSNIYNHIVNNEKLISSAFDAVKVMKTISKIKYQLK